MLPPLTLLNLLLTLAVAIGGVVAYRYGLSKTTHEIQDRVIHALQNEIATFHDRIAALEKENTRLDQTITTICGALKQRGIHITIDGDLISIRDEQSTSYTSRIYAVTPERQNATATPPRRRTRKTATREED